MRLLGLALLNIVEGFDRRCCAMEVSVGQRNHLCCIEHVASRRQAGRATDARYFWYSGTVGDDMLLGFAEPADHAVIESELANIELGETVTVCSQLIQCGTSL